MTTALPRTGVATTTGTRRTSRVPAALRSRRLRPLAVLGMAFAVYLLVSIGLWWQAWSTHPTGVATCGCDDPAFFVWFLAWPAYALSHGLNLFSSTLLFHPSGVNMLSNTSELIIGVPLAPVTLLFGPVATLNVALTLSPALSALAMFWLLRRWVRWTPAAFVGGLVYGFSPYMLTSLSIAHLMTAFLALLPLIVACLDELLVRQRRRPVPVGIALGLLVTAEFFVSTEVLAIAAIFGVVALVMLGGYAFATDRQDLMHRLPHAGRGLGAAAAVALVLLAYPLWFTFAGPAHLSGLVWPTLTPGGVGISPNGLWKLTFQDSGLVRLLSGYSGPALPLPEYLGLGLLVVLAGGLVLWRRDRRLWLFGAVGGISVLLSLGVNSGSWVPWHLLAHIPAIQNALPARFIAVTTLCAAVMLAIVVDRVHGTVDERARRAVAVRWAGRGPLLGGALASFAALGVAAVATVPLATAVIGKVPLTVQQAKLPAWFANVAPHLPPGQVVLAYPPPYAGGVPMLWQAMDSMHFALAGGAGPAALPFRAGRERAGVEVLTAASLSLPGPPPGTPATIDAVRQAIAGWRVTTVVVPDPVALPSYEQGRATGWALGVFTAALGRPPEFRDDAWVWSAAQSPAPALRLSTETFSACTTDQLWRSGNPQAVPSCITAAAAAAT